MHKQKMNTKKPPLMLNSHKHKKQKPQAKHSMPNDFKLQVLMKKTGILKTYKVKSVIVPPS